MDTSGSNRLDLTANAYAYGLDNPLAYTDPTGHLPNAISYVMNHPGMVLLGIPIIGTVYALGCAITGQDILTGEHLSDADRAMYALGGLLGLGELGGAMADIGDSMLGEEAACAGDGMEAFGAGKEAESESAAESAAADESNMVDKSDMMGKEEQSVADESNMVDKSDMMGKAEQSVETSAGTLGRLATQIRNQLVADPSIANSVLSQGELEAATREPWLNRVHGGNAIERFLADNLEVTSRFEHLGGAGRPDFVGLHDGLPYEVTSDNPATVASHLRRDYVAPDRLITYPGLPSDFKLRR